jgi:hypothetical protein
MLCLLGSESVRELDKDAYGCQLPDGGDTLVYKTLSFQHTWLSV